MKQQYTVADVATMTMIVVKKITPSERKIRSIVLRVLENMC